MIIDSHAHLFPESWESSGYLPQDMFEVDVLLERQDEAGIDYTLISDPHIWYGDLDLGDVRRAREYNDFAVRIQSERRERVGALATATPWRGEEHLREAERAISELGLLGIALSTSDRGSYLDEVPEAFWEMVEEYEVPVFLHPGGSVVGDGLMDGYRLGELCGRPLDMTLTLSRVILTGVLERHPTLRVLCAHAGGGIAMIAERLDFGHELRDYRPLGPWGNVRLQHPPSHYVHKLHFDTVTFGVAPLRLALDTVGSERLHFGSDGPPVPFPASRHLNYVRELAVGEEAMESILGGNAQALFGISNSCAT